MINATIDKITINEDELYNRIKAYGPGDGINRAAITREDASSIAQYGVREEVFDVPTATDFDDFVAKVDAHLEVVKDPVTEIEITFFYDTDRGPGGQIFEGEALTHDGEVIEYYRFGDEREIKRGDTIRIVSKSLNLNTTGVIEELDWEPGQVSLSIGSKRYNLLDVVFEEESRRERQEAALGLERPISFRAESGNPGCVVGLNPYVSPRAVGVEIYGSQTQGFTPDRETLLFKGTSSRVELQQLIPPNEYYFRARSYDASGNFSDFTDEVSANAGYLTGNGIEPSGVDNSRLDNDSVSEDKMQDGSVTEPKVRDGSISKDKIDANAVTADKIDAGAITADKISAGAVTADKIESGIVSITDAGGDTGQANSVRVGSGDNLVAMGYIGDQTNNNPEFGFYGKLASSVFIEGAPRIVDIYFEEVYEPTSATYTRNTSNSGIGEDLVWYYSIPLSTLNVSDVRDGNRLFLVFQSSLNLRDGNQDTGASRGRVGEVQELREGLSLNPGGPIFGNSVIYPVDIGGILGGSFDDAYATGKINFKHYDNNTGIQFADFTVSGQISFAIFEYDGQTDSGSVSFNTKEV